ncbi:MAG: 30S ribosomal protein S16 [Candidatus Buchananbacteria bacterium]
MLSIRFSRKGKKKLPLYSIIVVEKAKDPWGDYVEKLGTYNPHTKALEIKADRVEYWISKGAQPSESVHNLLITKEIIKGEKVRASKSKPGKKKSLQIAADKKAKDAEEAAAVKAKADAEATAEKEKEEKAKAEQEATEVEKNKVEEVAPVESAPAEEAVSETTETPAEETKTE